MPGGPGIPQDKKTKGIWNAIGGTFTFGTQSRNQPLLIMGGIAVVLAGVIGFFFGRNKKKGR